MRRTIEEIRRYIDQDRSQVPEKKKQIKQTKMKINPNLKRNKKHLYIFRQKKNFEQMIVAVANIYSVQNRLKTLEEIQLH